MMNNSRRNRNVRWIRASVSLQQGCVCVCVCVDSSKRVVRRARACTAKVLNGVARGRVTGAGSAVER